jgi:hypothetical protein
VPTTYALHAIFAASLSGCVGEVYSEPGTGDGGGPVVMIDLGPSSDAGPSVDAGAMDAGARDAGAVDSGPADPCAGVTCGAGARCDAATRACVCAPGFVDTGSACVAATPDDPAARTREALCARWNSDSVDRAASAWTPGASRCDPGAVPADAIDDTVRRVNLYRWLSGLGPVVEDAGQRARDQQCAHMMSVNGSLDHSPPTSWACYTADGAAGAGSSNLSLGVASGAEGIDLFMADRGVPSLGHRRWIVHGPLGRVGVGFSAGGRGASCLGVFDRSGASTRAWTAYPNEGLAPIENAGAAWSFHSESLGLAGATVSVVRASDGAARTVTVDHPPDGYGPDTVSFTPSGWTPTVGERYRVTIRGTSAGDITYEVELVRC